MKKILLRLAALCFAMGMMATSSLAANDEQKTVDITIFGLHTYMAEGGPALAQMSLPCVMQNNRTLVPIRDVAEAMGAYVNWISDSQEIGIYRDVPVYDTYEADAKQVSTASYQILLQIDNPIMYYRDAQVTDGAVTLDVAPQLIDGRTMLPVRAVCEYLNAKVEWHEESKSIVIYPIVMEALDAGIPGEYTTGNINTFLKH